MNLRCVPAQTALAAALCLGPHSTAVAQFDWNQLHLDPSPSPRSGQAMASGGELFGYNAALSFGWDKVLNAPDDELFTETNRANWHLTYGGGGDGPSPRYEHAMTFDRKRERFVIYGGYTFAGPSDETWEWVNNDHWLQRTDVGGPGPLYKQCMTYDEVRDVTILFGGAQVGHNSGKTWEYGGVSWKDVDVDGPPARNDAAMVYDAARGVCLLFGGLDNNFTHLHDTWSWDGMTWTKLSDEGPSGRYGHSMVYDPDRQSVILFGGYNFNIGYYGDTWEWDGLKWTDLQIPGPSPRYNSTMAWDTIAKEAILFGGYDENAYNGETWELTTEVICRADCDGDHKLSIFDFFCFVNYFNQNDPYADFDEDGEDTIFDFLSFVNSFNLGCP